MDRVRIVNTSRYSTAVVQALVTFARGTKRCGDVAVNVKNTRCAYAGRCYARVPSISPRQGDRLVIIRIGAPERFPRHVKYPGLVTAPEYEFRDWQEAMVGVAAHELAHAMQFETRSPRSEIEAEHAAMRAVERFRAERAALGLEGLEARERAADAVRVSARAVARAAKQSPAAKREKVLADLKRWESKAKLADTKLTKLRRRLRDLDRRIAALPAAQ